MSGTMAGRTRNYLTKDDKERIREAVHINGTQPATVARWYGVSEFTVRKICNLL